MDDRIEDYPTQPTDYLPHVIARCIEKANRHGRRFRFSLNGAIAVVSPGQSAEQVQAEIQRQWEAARRPPPPVAGPLDAGA
jgi:hypothetical protein